MTAPTPAPGSVLDPDRLTFHQQITFSADGSLAAALARSDAFRIAAAGDATIAEWIRLDPEDDASLFAYGRVTLAGSVLVVEAFCEPWLGALVLAVEELASGVLASDETRAIRFAELLERPEAILRAEGGPGGVLAARRDIAARFLRHAWPFLPESELGGRAPEVVAVTGRGREALAGVLPSLSDRLRKRWPEFPDLDADEVSEILFPERPLAPKPGPATTRVDPRSV